MRNRLVVALSSMLAACGGVSTGTDSATDSETQTGSAASTGTDTTAATGTTGSTGTGTGTDTATGEPTTSNTSTGSTAATTGTGSTDTSTSTTDSTGTSTTDSTGTSTGTTGEPIDCPGADVALIQASFVKCADNVHAGQTAMAGGVTCADVCCVLGFAGCQHRAAQADFDACTPVNPQQSGTCADVFQPAWSSQCACIP